MLFKNSKSSVIAWCIILLTAILITIVTIFAVNSYNNIEVWERKDDSYHNETIKIEEEKDNEYLEDTENIEEKTNIEHEPSVDSEKVNEQVESGKVTHNVIEETEDVIDKEISEPEKNNEVSKPQTEKEENIEKKEELCCTIEVRCDKILDNKDKLEKAKEDLVPANGVIFNKKEVAFKEGETVFDVLLRVLKESKIHLEFVKTPVNNNVYIEGINNIYEFDCGELSGWMYKVNDEFPNYGCGKYYLKNGDTVEFIYTCDLGRDIGGENINQK